jgi:hypothetical protein
LAKFGGNTGSAGFVREKAAPILLNTVRKLEDAVLMRKDLLLPIGFSTHLSLCVLKSRLLNHEISIASPR